MVTSSGELPTWLDFLKNIERAYGKTEKLFKDNMGDIDNKTNLFIRFQVATLFEQIWACLPPHIVHPEVYEDYMEDEDKEDSREQDDSKVVTGLVERVLAKVKRVFKSASANW